MEQNTCTEALAIFAARSFVHWHGLPAECDLNAVHAYFPSLSDGYGTGYLGQQRVRMIYRIVHAADYTTSVRVWLDNQYVVAMDVEYPNLVEQTDTLLAELGEPDARLDFSWDVLVLTGGELVYASRGITIFINPGNLKLLRLIVYPVCDIDTYVQTIRLNIRTREYP